MADHASPPNLMGYLFSREVLSQSLRLGLAGAWDHHHPEFIDALRMINTDCPSLVQSFLPIGERDAQEEETSGRSVEGNDSHHRIQLSDRGFLLPRTSRLYVNSNVKLMKLPLQHSFLQQLLDAYEVYLRRRPIDLGHKGIKWYRRVAYTNRRNRRHVYNTGDFIIVDDEKARLIQCLLHEYKRKRYGFLVVDLVNSTMLVDPVLDLAIYTQSDNHRIYPVTAISDETIYLIDAPTEPDWQTEEETKYLMHCTWNVDYL